MELKLKALRDRFSISLLEAYEYLIIILVCWLARPTNYSIGLGAIVSFIGIGLRIWTSGYPRDPVRFVVYGPYRFVRHPRLLGSFLMLLGVCVASRSSGAIVTMLLGTIVIFRSILHEEDHMLGRLAGSSFRDYSLHVSAFVPNIMPYARSADYPHRFSWGYAMLKSRRRQLDSTLVLVLGYAMLYGIKELARGGLLQTGLALGVTLVIVGKSLMSKP